MNREKLLDSLDGLKALVFRLLPVPLVRSIGCVPMATDGDKWNDKEKRGYEDTIGFSPKRTFWTPGGFVNVPSSNARRARSNWVDAVRTIKHPYLFLDPDTGFYTRHNGHSEKKILISELNEILQYRKALIVYRHLYWPKPKLKDVPKHTYPYVWHALRMLKQHKLVACAYQSQAASLFFMSRNQAGIAPFRAGLEMALSGVSTSIVQRRLIG